MKSRLIVLMALTAAVVLSATAVVYSTHRTRALFAELQSLNKARDRLNVEWERLQLEQGAWTTQGRIERLARERLDMRQPSPANVVMLYRSKGPQLDIHWKRPPERLEEAAQ